MISLQSRKFCNEQLTNKLGNGYTLLLIDVKKVDKMILTGNLVSEDFQKKYNFVPKVNIFLALVSIFDKIMTFITQTIVK